MLTRLLLVLAAIAAIAAIASLAPAQAPKPALVANAAPVYISHWNKLDMSALQFALMTLNPTEIGDERWPAPDALPYEAEALDSLTKGIIEASKIERCDFAWDRTRGPGTNLPHLGNLRASARLMAVLARREIDAGNPAGAVPYLAAGYRIASHCAQDQVTVSSSYAMTIFDVVDAVTRLAWTKTDFDASARAELIAALETLNREDPFYGAASVKGEAELFSAWMEGKVAVGQAAEVGDHIRAGLAGVGRLRIQMDPIMAKLANLEALDIALTEAWTYYDRIVEHWNDANPTKLQEAFADAIKAGVMLPLVPENVQAFHADWAAARDLYLARLHALAKD